MIRIVPVLWLMLAPMAAPAEMLLSPKEVQQTLAHGPWPPDVSVDPSNRVSGLSEAITFGAALFADPALSGDGTLACASCHHPDRAFTDGLPRAIGRSLLDRNTLTLVNVRLQRWFGWGGSSDNLWAQSVLPILNPDEMAMTGEGLRSKVGNGWYLSDYESLFGSPDGQDPDLVLVNLAKALAAYQETLMTKPTAFDRFRDALARGDAQAAVSYPHEAQRGLQIFLGRGRCVFCHSGPAFTNREFHDAGVPYFITESRVDPGRFGGLNALLGSPFTLAGAHSDDPERRGAWAVDTVRQSHDDFGTFRVPSLRGLTRTAPYMHDGSLRDLRAVVQHYNTLDLDRMHADGEAILAPMGLSAAQVDDLVAFLESLSGE